MNCNDNNNEDNNAVNWLEGIMQRLAVLLQQGNEARLLFGDGKSLFY